MKTIEQLAEKLQEKVWSKGDLKRIYLNDEGYNTKKMSTKTFIWQDENGDFKVSCRVECPSQSINWIKNQEQEVRDSVEERIKRALATEYFFAQNKETGEYYNDIDGKDGERYEAFLYPDTFLTQESIEKALRNNGKNVEDYNIFTEDREITITDRENAWAKLAEVKAVEAKQPEKQSLPPMSGVRENEFNPEIKEVGMLGVGTTVNHRKFGIGTIIEEDSNNVKVKFNDCEKKLIKKFAGLKVIENFL